MLLRDYQLGLVLIAGSAHDTGSQPVQWVHSSDLLDPSPFLTLRTVLLTTGTQFSDDLDADEAEAYVRRLIAAGTTALGAAIGVRWDRIPPALIEACDHLLLPLFRVPYDTPFIAIVRTAARLLEIEAHQAEQQTRGQLPSSTMLGRRQNLAAAEHALRRAVLQLLIAGERELAEEVAAGLMPRLPRGSMVVVSFGEPYTVPFLSEMNPLLLERAGTISAQLADRTTVITEQAELGAIRRLLVKHRVAAGISERGSTGELSDLLDQAERAEMLAKRRDPSGPLDYRPAMHAGVLQFLRSSPEAARRAQGLLAPLRRHDAGHSDALETSLTAWLRHHGQTSPAAAELGLHRHTLRARVQSAAELIGRDLDDPDARAEVWAALRLSPNG